MWTGLQVNLDVHKVYLLFQPLPGQLLSHPPVFLDLLKVALLQLFFLPASHLRCLHPLLRGERGSRHYQMDMHMQWQLIKDSNPSRRDLLYTL